LRAVLGVTTALDPLRGIRETLEPIRRIRETLDPLSEFRARAMGVAPYREPDFKTLAEFQRINKKAELAFLKHLATPPPRSNSIRWIRFFVFYVAYYLESSRDKALAGQAPLLCWLIAEGLMAEELMAEGLIAEKKPEDVYRLAYRLALSLWRAVYWAFLLALLGHRVDLEEEEQEPEAERSSAEREKPPPRPVVTAFITPTTVTPTAPNATA
jgi:hypothetical protein